MISGKCPCPQTASNHARQYCSVYCVVADVYLPLPGCYLAPQARYTLSLDNLHDFTISKAPCQNNRRMSRQDPLYIFTDVLALECRKTCLICDRLEKSSAIGYISAAFDLVQKSFCRSSSMSLTGFDGMFLIITIKHEGDYIHRRLHVLVIHDPHKSLFSP